MGWYDNCIEGFCNSKVHVYQELLKNGFYSYRITVLYGNDKKVITPIKVKVPLTMYDVADMIVHVTSNVGRIDPNQVFFTNLSKTKYNIQEGNMGTVVEKSSRLFNFDIVHEDIIGCWKCEECAKYYKHYDPEKIECKCPKDSYGEPLSPVYDISCPTCGIDNEDNCLCDNSSYNNKDE